MGNLFRRDFSGGWNPSADAVNASVNALLRMDNLVLDDEGIVSLRPGSIKVQTTALNGQVTNLYTAVLNGIRYRMASTSGGYVYSNGTHIGSSYTGTGVSFIDWLGQIFFTWNILHEKWDGTTKRNWGIAKPAYAPSPVNQVKPSLSAPFAGSSGYSLVINEGTGDDDEMGPDGWNPATWIEPSATTQRGVATVTKTTGYTDLWNFTGATGLPDDDFRIWVYFEDPATTSKVTLMLDLGSSVAFVDDYYIFKWDLSLSNPVIKPDIGWNELHLKRSDFTRVGTTPNKDWSTIKAIRVVNEGSGQIIVSSIIIYGGTLGALNGKYQWRFALVKQFTNYQAISPLSDASVVYEVKQSGVNVTCNHAGHDTQSEEVWLYRIGGELDRYYRVATATIAAGTYSTVVSDVMSDTDAAVLDIVADTSTIGPPDNTVDIEGPYYDRIFCLTQTHLHPSKVHAPENFLPGQVLLMADVGEVAFWVKKALGGLYVGTSKDIYRIDGTFAEYPDGTMDVVKRNCNIANPPVSSNACAQEGNLLIYMAADGWRAFNGVSSERITGPTDLLWRGQTRHGISPINIEKANATSATARFFATVHKHRLISMIPEGISTGSTQVIYKFDMDKRVWYRHTYTPYWRSVHTEPDGTLIAGDTSGYIWQLDTGTTDGTALIPVTMWTKVDDNNQPLNRKDPNDHQILIDTGGLIASVNLHLDGSATTSKTIFASQTGEGIVRTDLTEMNPFIQVQHRITGSFSTFKFYNFNLLYLDLPQLFEGKVQDSNGGYPCGKVISGIHYRVNTLGLTRQFTPYFDNVIQPPFVLTTTVKEPDDFIHNLLAPTTVEQVAWTVDGKIELYGWDPVILYKLPCPKKVWDTGYVDTGTNDITWMSLVKVKAKTPANLIITPYFDDTSFPSYTATALPNKTTVYSVPVGREYKGRSPRIVVTAGGYEFLPYWVEFYYRPSGNQTEKKPLRIGVIS